jgi:hypothetical protein
MITNIIVIAAIVFAVAFVAAWALSANLRAWIERPKYAFRSSVARYDEAQAAKPSSLQASKPSSLP